MEKINYIPLGSIVLLSGGTQKVMIISRGLNVQNGGRVLFFDYAGVPYPCRVWHRGGVPSATHRERPL